MPNWCWNTLEVRGTKKGMKKFYNKFKSNNRESFDFEWFVPMPAIFREITTGFCTIDGVKYEQWVENADGSQRGLTHTEIDIMTEEYGHTNWYDWSLENWGCKWNCSDVEVHEATDSQFILKFDTPWGPPVKFINHLIEQFSDLDFENEWEEDGGYAGVFGYIDGHGYNKDGRVVYKTECCDVDQEYDEEKNNHYCPKCKEIEPYTYTEVEYTN